MTQGENIKVPWKGSRGADVTGVVDGLRICSRRANGSGAAAEKIVKIGGKI